MRRMMRKLLAAVAVLAGFGAQAMCGQVALGVGTWAAAPMGFPAGTAGRVDQTLREVVHVSVGSSDHGFDDVSIVLSNEFGIEPLRIGAATIGLRAAPVGAAQAAAGAPVGSSVSGVVAVTFGGKPDVVIAPGKSVASDSVRMHFAPQSDVVVSLFVPAQPMTTVTAHGFANATNYVAAGDQTAALDLSGAQTVATIGSWRYLKEVRATRWATRSIVCFGDSITDGSRSTKDANLRWPDLLGARLLASKHAPMGILNEGIGGNRILTDVTGPAGIARFERDALQHEGVEDVIILLGINDIGHAYDPLKPYDMETTEDLIAGYRYMIARAHARHVRVIGATLTPYVGAKYASTEGERVRQALNAWIRTTKELDGVIDFDKATVDPAHPGAFLPEFDSGDHLHPNDAGMRAMADSINLQLFEK